MSQAATAVNPPTPFPMTRKASADQFIRELVGDNVRLAREQVGLTQHQLAERVKEARELAGESVPRLEMERQQVSLWENGRKLPSAQSLIAIACATGHDDLGWFYSRHDESDPAAPAP